MKFSVVCGILIGAFLVGCASSVRFENSSRFDYVNDDLLRLKSESPENSDVDELLNAANRISEMNNHCRSIPLNEVLDSACERFYAVDLPKFEKRYSEVAGEIRIGRVQLENSVKNKIAQINACAEALKVFYVPIDRLVKTDAVISDVIPLNADGSRFKVNYELSVEYDKDVLKWMENTAKKWDERCGTVVFDGQEKELLDVFVDQVESMNGVMRQNGADVYAYRLWERSESYGRIDDGFRFDLKHRTNRWIYYPSVAFYINGSQVEEFNFFRMNSKNTFFEIRPEYFGQYGNRTGSKKFSMKKQGSKEFSGEYPAEGIKGRWIWDH